MKNKEWLNLNLPKFWVINVKILEREVKSMLDTKLVKLNRKIHGEIIFLIFY